MESDVLATGWFSFVRFAILSLFCVLTFPFTSLMVGDWLVCFSIS